MMNPTPSPAGLDRAKIAAALRAAAAYAPAVLIAAASFAAGTFSGADALALARALLGL